MSLGGIETRIEHPWSTTHADMTPEQKLHAVFGPAMIRLSVGLEALAPWASSDRPRARC